MIAFEDSIPTKSEKYLTSIDIFYTQFNDINFYFEDSGKENFYTIILQKLFPEKKIKKIFGLNGKASVIQECEKNLDSKAHIYILDKDFDDILNLKKSLSNLFYLDRYSIENFLFEEMAFVEFILEQNPLLNKTIVSKNLKAKESIKSNATNLRLLTSLYIVAQKNRLPIKNCSLKPERFCKQNEKFLIDASKVQSYKTDLETALKAKDKRLTISGQLRSLRLTPKSNLEFVIKHCPGKYLLYYLKEKIQSVFGLISINIESFVFRVVKNSSLESLFPMRDLILTYCCS